MCVLTLYQDVLTPLKDRKNNWTKTARINFGPSQCRLAANVFFKKRVPIERHRFFPLLVFSFYYLLFSPSSIFAFLPVLFLLSVPLIHKQKLIYIYIYIYSSHSLNYYTTEIPCILLLILIYHMA